ncbi:Intracellular sulfur oxidation protein, DsrE/DsrF family [Oryzisolibacter propanilivorax]|uniref:Intracellular sulfur oxidation protein, DsrE/DsrF family n=1 Tax=Oryzisolibacter propanilivorax TaxID=1527607 RepID=A0A1G9QAD1_9BURK|nr:hypothetical protein [Oryzisolibacter propanilivorax]SDM08028.1 Intracellular sulfur oxidation protein, DsrE/DsrF family [Oryzisolibacter propanilivorax]
MSAAHPSPPAATARLVLHAPTRAALERARRNAGNAARVLGQDAVRIVVNGDAVATTLDEPQPATDALTLVCGNTLKQLERQADAPLRVLPEGAVVALATMQDEGWRYVRA